MHGTIFTTNNARSIRHRDGVAIEARPIPRRGWRKWVEYRRGVINYQVGLITWSDGSTEWVQPFAG